MQRAPILSRRAALAAAAATAATAATAAATATAVAAADAPATPVRAGLLQFGTMQWLADVVVRHGLDRAHGFVLRPVVLANNDAGRIALMAGSADVILTDWLFAAAQRHAGNDLSFAPFSSASGGIMVPADSSIRGLGDLRGRRLGVAGGPLDRSWLLVQAASRAEGVPDLARATTLVYAAPPLLSAKLRQGELDAVLTFWTFAAALQASGFRQAVSVDACAQALGLPTQLGLLGFVFHAAWAERNRAALDGFLAAMHDAEDRLRPEAPGAAAEWAAIRKLMRLPTDSTGQAVFELLRARFLASLGGPSGDAQARVADRVLEVLKRTGGARATEGVEALPPGLFWRARG